MNTVKYSIGRVVNVKRSDSVLVLPERRFENKIMMNHAAGITDWPTADRLINENTVEITLEAICIHPTVSVYPCGYHHL